VRSGARLVGAAQFGFDTGRIDDEIADLTRDRILMTLALVGLGVTVAFLLANNFVRPIRQLVKATEEIASGNLATRVPAMPGHEMRDLGRSFNAMADELQGMVEALQESRARVVTAEEGVRREIAAHLHGPVQGRLLALRAQIDQLAGSHTIPDEEATRLSVIAEDMGEVIQREIAVLSRRLYPAIVRRGLIPSLQSLSDQFESTLDIEVRVEEDLAARERANARLASEATRLAAYRIAEEAISNVVKHAKTDKAAIELGDDEGWVTLTIRDQGAGFHADASSGGLGLSAMQDYAEAVGGTCIVRAGSTGGTEVSARLPMQNGVEAGSTSG
jgi:nitrate/nitrite-specific signal transduction histidine kinase